MEQVSRYLTSTGTLSDEVLAISIKSFLLHNLDNIFVSSFQGNDRIKSCYKYCQSESVLFVELNCEICGNAILGMWNEYFLNNLTRDQAGGIDLNT
jgi:hypothetical protein